MDINSIITREEYESMERPSYDQFYGFLMKAVKLSVEESLKALPHVMTHLANQVNYLKDLSTKFYEDNKDLVDHKQIVAQTIEQVESDNPGILYEEILKIAAVKAKETLNKINKVIPLKNRNPLSFNDNLKRV